MLFVSNSQEKVDIICSEFRTLRPGRRKFGRDKCTWKRRRTILFGYRESEEGTPERESYIVNNLNYFYQLTKTSPLSGDFFVEACSSLNNK